MSMIVAALIVGPWHMHWPERITQADRPFSPRSHVAGEVPPCFTREGPGVENGVPSWAHTASSHAWPPGSEHSDVQSMKERRNLGEEQVGAASWP